MFVAGYGRRAKRLGDGPIIACPNCHNLVRTVVVEISRRASVMFVPVAKWNLEFWLVCPVCSRGGLLEDRRQAQLLIAESLAGEMPTHRVPARFGELDRS